MDPNGEEKPTPSDYLNAGNPKRKPCIAGTRIKCFRMCWSTWPSGMPSGGILAEFS